MRLEFVRFVCLLICATVFSMAGCDNSTPQGPEKGSVQKYLDEHPEAAARLDDEGETDETDGEGAE